MNKYKHHMLWLMLPAVLVVFALVIFQPGSDLPPAVSTTDDVINTVPGQNTASVAPEGSAEATGITDNNPQTSDATDQDSDEVAQDREYIDYAFPLLSTWNLQEVKSLLADTTIASSTDEELSQVMAVLEDRLGELKYFETPQPVAMEGAEEPAQTEDGELQHYQFIAYYEAGEAEINLILHKKLDANSLYSFNINVPN